MKRAEALVECLQGGWKGGGKGMGESRQDKGRQLGMLREG